jgi:hypothetical protein
MDTPPFSFSRLVATLFAFVFVFTWLYMYIPMLIDIPSIKEIVDVISVNERSLFSAGGLLEVMKPLWPGVILCLIFGFFLLDIGRILPLIIITLATTIFLPQLKMDSMIHVDPKTFNSLFLFTQFLSLGTLFVLHDRYAPNGFKTWKEFFKGRLSIAKRLSAHRALLKPFLRELFWVALFLSLGSIPAVLESGVGYTYMGTYFINVGIVFFYSFFISSFLSFTQSESNKSSLKHTLYKCLLLYAFLVILILMLPAVISLVFSLIFSIFGQGGIQASIVHAPGTAYFVSFFSFKSFLYSGLDGLVNLATLLVSVYFITGTRIKRLGLEKDGYTVPATIFFLIIIGLFSFITANNISSIRLKSLLEAKEVFSMKSIATRVCVDKDRIITVSDGKCWVKIHDRITGKELANISTSFTLDDSISIHDVGFHSRGLRVVGDTLYLQMFASPYRPKKKAWFIAGYTIDLKNGKLLHRWEKRTKKWVYPVDTIVVDKTAIQLVYDSKAKKFQAFALQGKLLWSKKHSASHGGEHWSRTPQGVASIRTKYAVLKDVDFSSLLTPVKKQSLPAFYVVDPASSTVQTYSLKDGAPIQGFQKITASEKKSAIRPVKANKVLLSGYDTPVIISIDLAHGYYEDKERFYGVAHDQFYGLDKKTGIKLWSVKLKAFNPHFILPARDAFYLVKSNISETEVAVLLIDCETGQIRGNWRMRGHMARDAFITPDKTIWLTLQNGKDVFKSKVIGLKFKTKN